MTWFVKIHYSVENQRRKYLIKKVLNFCIISAKYFHMILFCQLFFTDVIEAEVNSLNFQKLHDTYILAGAKLRPFTIQNNKISAAFQAKTADLSSRSR